MSHAQSHAQNFALFHAANPDVYNRLVAMTLRLKERGRERIGIAMLWEVIRWEHEISTTGDKFKLCNNYRAFYARLIERRVPELDGIFTKRRSAADYTRPPD